MFWYNPSNLFYKGQEISSPQAWSFDGPPEVQSVKEGISTVRVRLSARRKLRFESVGSIGSAFAIGAAFADEIDPMSFDDCDFIGRAPEEGPGATPFDPMEYTFWRVLDATNGTPLTNWNATAITQVTYQGPTNFCPGGNIAWFGGADINVVPPTTSAGGFMGGVFITNLSGGVIAPIRQWFGAASTGAPFVVSDPVSFEFSDSASTVDRSWSGVSNPC